jgi:acetyltransferase-like isoleucine patch superfamily enzyme
MKPNGLLDKAFWILRNRPAEFLRRLQDYARFGRSRLLLPFFGPDPELVTLGRNVRLQKLNCLNAERPDARISLGDHSIVYRGTQIGAYGNGRIEIGPCAVLGDIKIVARHGVKIGSRFLCSWNVYVQDFDPHPLDPGERRRQVEAICASFHPRFEAVPFDDAFEWSFPGEPIEIGDDVWVGANCTILKGARIGSGCIVAAGAVVPAGSYPDRSVIAGNPARVVKTLG